ncbi:MAG: recombination protein O N-terminal domain-containing protein [Candidatus Hydrogenedentota bacterium]
MSGEIDTRSRNFEVCVLGSRKLRENDRIMLLLARDFGRLDAVVPGVRRPGSRFAGAFEPFTFLKGSFYRRLGGELWTVKEAEVQVRPPSSEDWRMPVVMQSAGELIYHAGPHEGMEKATYPLAATFRRELGYAREPWTPLLAFYISWSSQAGFGLPDAPLKSGAANFISRVTHDDPANWRRYRLSAPTRDALFAVCIAHAEEHTEKKWTGLRMLRDSFRAKEISR